MKGHVIVYLLWLQNAADIYQCRYLQVADNNSVSVLCDLKQFKYIYSFVTVSKIS